MAQELAAGMKEDLEGLHNDIGLIGSVHQMPTATGRNYKHIKYHGTAAGAYSLPQPRLQKFDKNQPVIRLRKKAIPNVLIADDNVLHAVAAKHTFEKYGCRARVAFNGRQALELMERQVFDAVFIDIQMPVLDGVELAEIIRHTEESAKLNYSTFLIAMLTLAESQDELLLDDAYGAGIDRFCLKPLSVHGPLIAQLLSSGISSLEGFRRTCLEKRWVARFARIKGVLKGFLDTASIAAINEADDPLVQSEAELLIAYGDGDDNTDVQRVESIFTRQKREDRERFEEQLQGYRDKLLDMTEQIEEVKRSKIDTQSSQANNELIVSSAQRIQDLKRALITAERKNAVLEKIVYDSKVDVKNLLTNGSANQKKVDQAQMLAGKAYAKTQSVEAQMMLMEDEFAKQGWQNYYGSTVRQELIDKKAVNTNCSWYRALLFRLLKLTNEYCEGQRQSSQDFSNYVTRRMQLASQSSFEVVKKEHVTLTNNHVGDVVGNLTSFSRGVRSIVADILIREYDFWKHVDRENFGQIGEELHDILAKWDHQQHIDVPKDHETQTESFDVGKVKIPVDWRGLADVTSPGGDAKRSRKLGNLTPRARTVSPRARAEAKANGLRAGTKGQAAKSRSKVGETVNNKPVPVESPANISTNVPPATTATPTAAGAKHVDEADGMTFLTGVPTETVPAVAAAKPRSPVGAPTKDTKPSTSDSQGPKAGGVVTTPADSGASESGRRRSTEVSITEPSSEAPSNANQPKQPLESKTPSGVAGDAKPKAGAAGAGKKGSAGTRRSTTGSAGKKGGASRTKHRKTKSSDSSAAEDTSESSTAASSRTSPVPSSKGTPPPEPTTKATTADSKKEGSESAVPSSSTIAPLTDTTASKTAADEPGAASMRASGSLDEMRPEPFDPNNLTPTSGANQNSTSDKEPAVATSEQVATAGGVVEEEKGEEEEEEENPSVLQNVFGQLEPLFKTPMYVPVEDRMDAYRTIQEHLAQYEEVTREDWRQTVSDVRDKMEATLREITTLARKNIPRSGDSRGSSRPPGSRGGVGLDGIVMSPTSVGKGGDGDDDAMPAIPEDESVEGYQETLLVLIEVLEEKVKDAVEVALKAPTPISRSLQTSLAGSFIGANGVMSPYGVVAAVGAANTAELGMVAERDADGRLVRTPMENRAGGVAGTTTPPPVTQLGCDSTAQPGNIPNTSTSLGSVSDGAPVVVDGVARPEVTDAGVMVPSVHSSTPSCATDEKQGSGSEGKPPPQFPTFKPTFPVGVTGGTGLHSRTPSNDVMGQSRTSASQKSDLTPPLENAANSTAIQAHLEGQQSANARNIANLQAILKQVETGAASGASGLKSSESNTYIAAVKKQLESEISANTRSTAARAFLELRAKRSQAKNGVTPDDTLTHTVTPGETLKTVAEAYGCKESEIEDANALAIAKGGDVFAPGNQIVVPVKLLHLTKVARDQTQGSSVASFAHALVGVSPKPGGQSRAPKEAAQRTSKEVSRGSDMAGTFELPMELNADFVKQWEANTVFPTQGGTSCGSEPPSSNVPSRAQSAVDGRTDEDRAVDAVVHAVLDNAMYVKSKVVSVSHEVKKEDQTIDRLAALYECEPSLIRQANAFVELPKDDQEPLKIASKVTIPVRLDMINKAQKVAASRKAALQQEVRATTSQPSAEPGTEGARQRTRQLQQHQQQLAMLHQVELVLDKQVAETASTGTTLGIAMSKSPRGSINSQSDQHLLPFSSVVEGRSMARSPRSRSGSRSGNPFVEPGSEPLLPVDVYFGGGSLDADMQLASAVDDSNRKPGVVGVEALHRNVCHSGATEVAELVRLAKGTGDDGGQTAADEAKARKILRNAAFFNSCRCVIEQRTASVIVPHEVVGIETRQLLAYAYHINADRIDAENPQVVFDEISGKPAGNVETIRIPVRAGDVALAADHRRDKINQRIMQLVRESAVLEFQGRMEEHRGKEREIREMRQNLASTTSVSSLLHSIAMSPLDPRRAQKSVPGSQHSKDRNVAATPNVADGLGPEGMVVTGRGKQEEDLVIAVEEPHEDPTTASEHKKPLTKFALALAERANRRGLSSPGAQRRPELGVNLEVTPSAPIAPHKPKQKRPPQIQTLRDRGIDIFFGAEAENRALTSQSPSRLAPLEVRVGAGGQLAGTSYAKQLTTMARSPKASPRRLGPSAVIGGVGFKKPGIQKPDGVGPQNHDSGYTEYRKKYQQLIHGRKQQAGAGMSGFELQAKKI